MKSRGKLEEGDRRGQGRRRQPGERGAWECDNCRTENGWPRKRCTDCGTSRC